MICPHCNRQIENTDIFCPFCGNPILNQVTNPQKEINKSFNKGIIISVIAIIVILVLLFGTIFIVKTFNLNSKLVSNVVFIIFIISMLIYMLFLFQDGFAKKGQDVRYRVVINSKFTDDNMLEQALLQKLNDLGYQKDSNYSDNTYHKKTGLNTYITYNIHNGKIYLAAFVKILNKEVAPNYGYLGIMYKEIFMNEITDLINFFEF